MLLIGYFEWPWCVFIWEDRKDTDWCIVWGLILTWSGRCFKRTVCRLCLCGRGYCMVVFWYLVVGSTILLTVPVSLATLFCCCIGLIICLNCMILCSPHHITSWWLLKKCGIGRVQHVPVWMPWGAMGDLSFLCVYIAVSYNMLYVWLEAGLLV